MFQEPFWSFLARLTINISWMFISHRPFMGVATEKRLGWKSTEYLSIQNLPCNHPTRNAWGPNPMYSRRRIAAMPVTSRGFRSRHRQVTRTEWSTSKSQVMASTHSNTQRELQNLTFTCIQQQKYTTTKNMKKNIQVSLSLMNSCEIVINNSYLRQAQLRGQSMRRPAV